MIYALKGNATQFYSRKLHKGRPSKFKTPHSENIQSKKHNLFETINSQQESMNLINLIFHIGKITQEEFDVACFIESVFMKASKNSGVSKLPSSAPHTWNLSIQNRWYMLNAQPDIKSQNLIKRMKDFVAIHNPGISNDFFDIISRHYTYEELFNIKENHMLIADTLQKGIRLIKKMMENF